MTLKEKLLDAEEYLDTYKLKLKEKLGLFESAMAYPYRGYGNEQQAILKGRVLEKEKTIHSDEARDRGALHNALRFFKRYESDEIPGVTLMASFAGSEKTVTSGGDGYFEFHFNYHEKPDPGWHPVTIEVVESKYDLSLRETSEAEIFIPQDSPDFGIISDVDDTLIESNATNLIERIVTMIRHTARTRPVFEGVKELYDGLLQNGRNPLWFVSGSSYNLHDLLTELAEFNELPKAPFMLRDLGMDDNQWLKRDTSPYKMMHLRNLFEMYPQLSFVLLGDSGQQDPEIYKKLAGEFPGRIRAIYIRHVTGEDRRKEVEAIAGELTMPVVLISDSKDALRHAEETGLITA